MRPSTWKIGGLGGRVNPLTAFTAFRFQSMATCGETKTCGRAADAGADASTEIARVNTTTRTRRMASIGLTSLKAARCYAELAQVPVLSEGTDRQADDRPR